MSKSKSQQLTETEELNKYPLFMTDLSGCKLDEPAAQFILSLAPKAPCVIRELPSIFINDKVGRSYYWARQTQLNASMGLSSLSGQYSLYTDIYLPALKSFIDFPVDKQAMDLLCSKIDNLNSEISEYITWKEVEPFHAANQSHTSKILSFLGLGKDPFSFLDQSFEHYNLIQKIKEVITLSEERIFMPISGKIILTTQYTPFIPNMQEMQSQVLSQGYFIDHVGRYHFCTPQTAHDVMQLALRSIFPAQTLIASNHLIPLWINRISHTITHII